VAQLRESGSLARVERSEEAIGDRRDGRGAVLRQRLALRREHRVRRARVVPVRLARHDSPAFERTQEAGDPRRGQCDETRQIDPAQPVARRLHQVMHHGKIRQADAVNATELDIDAALPESHGSANRKKLTRAGYGRSLTHVRSVALIIEQSINAGMTFFRHRGGGAEEDRLRGRPWQPRDLCSFRPSL